MPSSSELHDALAKLRARFAASSGNTIAAFAKLADQVQRNPASPEVLDALRRELHRLHGTAGSYGFHEASRIAGALEMVVTRWMGDPALDTERRGAVLRQFVTAVGAALSAAPQPEESPLGHRLLLVDLDDETAAPLVTEGMHRGYFVERITASAFDGMLVAGLPQAVIAAARVSLTVPDGVSVVLLQDTDGQVAPHADGACVMDQGSDAHDVLVVVESLAEHTGMAGASMLVVDDDAAMLEVLRAIGEAAGMYVETIASADAIVEVLDRHRPALLLMDIVLPGTGGIAATQLLRAERRFAELPILLLSAHTDPETREAAFAAGADDFQSKPVVATELTHRIARLLEVHRQRLLARGIHPATALPLPARTVRGFDETLRTAAAAAEPCALALMRPLQPPDGRHRSAAWHRECAMIAAALGVDGGEVGFIDETTLALLLPMSGAAAAERLTPLADAARREPVAWCAGVAELRAGAEPTTRMLERAAEEAWLSAREASRGVHLWGEADAQIAPDVIVVEDDEALADLVSFALGARGLTFTVFRNGPDALDGLRVMRAHGRHPVVLMDVDLPGLDGFSLFERLRLERPGAFHVVFLSAHASEGDQLRALRAGALDYLAKPVSLRVLMAKISVWREQDRPA
jgi:DNA-binding response OmpR family regulator